ncbi:ABC-F family ATP-binding cassette domain-containing protein [Streptosporangium sp. NBC_01756]|uniref:ABC-F family ATP-binding cassette domain-containing protein n=1 Tax=Streptosporangium sp. NBC_01756 TaxID=2975950 RepID=UPI002DD9F19C|nr:ABC-F family ATP-binding cassette domain-containing protein [Streptosporangium sp. NBC_01756]WSC85936.1 ATP-binding cassette domain-containing protein [Streptosporangium sp. NBC_01756]
MTRPSQLTVTHVTKAYVGHAVLEDVSFTVAVGERAGVIGENGSGKSTVLRLLGGQEKPDDGEVVVVAPGGVGYLDQTLDLPVTGTVQDAADAALADLRDLERRIREAEESLADASPEELALYGDLVAAYEARDGYGADARIDAAMHGLGVAHLARDRRLGGLSGGERSRLALACVLAAAPEVLLLDEPTNDLDEAAVTWLENRLRAHRGTVVTVTHDRTFLERVATTILEVDHDRRTVTRYGDGWDGYLAAKAAARRRWEQDYQEWLAEIDRQTDLAGTGAVRLASSVWSSDRPRTAGHRRSHEAGLSGQIRKARERLRRLSEEPVPRPPDPLRFTARFGGDAGSADDALRLGGGDVGAAGGNDGSVRLGGGDVGGVGRPVRGTGADPGDAVRSGGEAGDVPLAALNGVRVGDRLAVEEFTLVPGQRVLLTGPNGAGKTTFLRVLAGDLAQDAGTVRRPERIGYLRQEIPVRRSKGAVLAAYAKGLPGSLEEHAAALLALGLFQREDLVKPLAALSIGQQRRLELARLVSRPVDLLILDEPTNHFSLTLVEELQEALAAYPGALVVVSHDRRFRDDFVGSHAVLRAGRLLS